MFRKFLVGLWVVLCVTALEAKAEEIWVIGAGSESTIWKALGGDATLSGGWKLDSVSIERSQVKACYKQKSSKPFCLTVVHPDQAEKNAHKAGAASVVCDKKDVDASKKKLLDVVATRLKRSGWANVWTRSKKEGSSMGKEDSPRVAHLLEITDYLMSQERFDLSRIAWNMAAEIDPDNPELQIRKIRQDILESKLKSVRKWIEENEKRFPDLKAKFSVEKAKIFALEENFPEAFKVLESIAEKGKISIDACNGVVDISKLVGKKISPKMQLEFLLKSLNSFDFCDDVWKLFSDKMLEAGRALQFLERLEQKIAQQPEKPEWLRLKAMALWRLKRFRETLAVWEKLYDLSPDPTLVDRHTSLITRLADEKDLYDQMVRRLNEKPGDMLARHAIAILNYYHRNYETCRTMVDELIKVLPEDPRLYIYGAMSRYELGDWDGARQWLFELDNKGFGDGDLYYCKAVIWHRKDPAKALENLDIFIGRPVGPEDHLPKHAHAVEIREQLARGETIWEWLPDNEYPIDPFIIPYLIDYGIPVAIAVLLLFVLSIVLFAKKRKKS